MASNQTKHVGNSKFFVNIHYICLPRTQTSTFMEAVCHLDRDDPMTEQRRNKDIELSRVLQKIWRTVPPEYLKKLA